MQLLNEWLTGYISVDCKWICLFNINQGMISKLSVINGIKFSNKPHEFHLNNTEERRKHSVAIENVRPVAVMNALQNPVTHKSVIQRSQYFSS